MAKGETNLDEANLDGSNHATNVHQIPSLIVTIRDR